MRESRLLITVSLLMMSSSLFGQELSGINVDSSNAVIGRPVSITIAISGQRQSSSCNALVSFGDGSTEELRFETNQSSRNLTHTYASPGNYNISVQGKTQFRGLKTVLACGGTNQSAAVVVHSEDVVTREPTERAAGKAEPATAAAEKLPEPRTSEFRGYEVAKPVFERKDYSSALRACRTDAEQGEPRCQNMLGFMFANGFGVQKDFSQAMQWYRKAVNQDDSRAQANMAGLFYRGEGVKIDYMQAFALFLKAAEQGRGGAQYMVGQMYSRGEGTPQDNRHAVAWFTKVTEQKDPEISETLKSEARKRIQELAPRGAAPQSAEKTRSEQMAEIDEKAKTWKTNNQVKLPLLIAEMASKPTTPAYEVCQVRYADDSDRRSCLLIVSGSDEDLWSKYSAAQFLKVTFELTCLSDVSPFFNEDFQKRCKTDGKGVYEIVRALVNGATPRNCGQYGLSKLNRSELKIDKSWAVLAIPKGQRKHIAGELINFTGQRMIIRQTQMQAELQTLESKGLAGVYFSGGQVEHVRNFAVVLVNSKTTTIGGGGKLKEPFGVLGAYKSNENIKLKDGSAIPAAVIQAECIETP